MAKTLSCYVDMFSLSQSVIFPNGEEERIATKDLKSYLPAVCYSHGYDKIHLFGNEKFLEEIVEAIYEDEIDTYGIAKLKIEVN